MGTCSPFKVIVCYGFSKQKITKLEDFEPTGAPVSWSDLPNAKKCLIGVLDSLSKPIRHLKPPIAPSETPICRQSGVGPALSGAEIWAPKWQSPFGPISNTTEIPILNFP